MNQVLINGVAEERKKGLVGGIVSYEAQETFNLNGKVNWAGNTITEMVANGESLAS